MSSTFPRDMTLHFDGGCAGNPGGTMRFGWHLDDADGNRVAEQSGVVDGAGYAVKERSNNTAEFHAALAGLEWVAAFRLYPVDLLTVTGDSQLVVRIMAGDWKAKKPHLKELADQCEAAMRMMDVGHIEWEWVPREENAEADRICGRPLPFGPRPCGDVRPAASVVPT